MKMLALDLAVPVPLEPRAFVCEEELNHPFLLRVDAVSKDPSIDLDALIGCAARASLFRGGEIGVVATTFTGIVRRAKLLKALEGSLSHYALEVVPKLWLLSQSRTYRTFQVMSEPAIALQVLKEWEIPVELRIDPAAYPRREIRVQYGESDLELVGRLLEEAGITYWFETIDDESTLVLGDAPHTARASMQLPLHDEGIDAPHLADAAKVTIRRRLRPGKYTVRDVDLRRAPDQQPVATATSDDATPLEVSLERFHCLPGTFLVETEGGGDTPVADERIAVRTDLRAGEALVARRLAAKRSDHKLLTLETTEPTLRPGTTFEILGHSSRELGPGRPWLATRVRLRADENRRPRISVEASPASSVYRPPLRTPQVVVDSVEPAIVICREGEEIDPNELGAVRVHFPWERTEAIGGSWVPVSQPWAGQGFGKINLPRHGQEVLVEFLGGNPDRPVITGRMYNAVQPVPYKLPDNKTQSGWRSNSTNRTGGYNEFMMEDAKEEELLRMQAERDLTTTALRNESRTIDNDRTANVGRDDQRTVKRDQSLQVDGKVEKIIGGTSDSLVGGDGTHVMGRSYQSRVNQDRSYYTTAGTSSIIGVDDFVSIEGAHNVTGITTSSFHVGGTSIVMSSASITMKTAGGAKVVIEPGRIEITCDILDIQADRECKVTAPSTNLNFDELRVEGFAMVDVQSSMITLNGGGKPFSRIMDEAPDKIMNGAGTVLVGA
jgi:type VI secretion system secreted protein VgrG